MLYELIEHLFAFDISRLVSADVRELCVASVLRHWDAFVADVSAKPNGEFSGVNYAKHFFVNKVHQAMARAAVPMPTFDSWQKEIRDWFLRRNMVAIPIQDFERHGGDSNMVNRVLMDPSVNNLVDGYQQLRWNHEAQLELNRRLQGQVSALQSDLQQMLSTVQSFMKYQTEMSVFTMKQVDCIYKKMHSGFSTNPEQPPSPIPPFLQNIPQVTPASSHDREEPNTTPQPMQYEPSFEIACTALKTGDQIEQFVFFFQYEAPRGYENDKSSETWNAKEQKERTSIKNKMHRLKNVVRYMLHFLMECPETTPPTSSEQYKIWLQGLRRSAELSVEEISQKHDNKKHPFTQASITEFTKNITWEATMLPANTPDFLIEFFLPPLSARRKKRKKEEADT